MAIKDKVRALLTMQGKKNQEAAAYLDLTPQSFQNKLSRGSFSAEDLIRLADFAGSTLAFLTDDGQRISLDVQDCRPSRKEESNNGK